MVATISIIIISLLCLSYISIGKYIQVIVSTTPGTVSLDCSIRNIYLLDFSSIESTKDVGDRSIVVRIFSNSDNLFTIPHANVSNYIGYYVMKSPTLPPEVNLDHELYVTIQLNDAEGNLIAEDAVTILNM